MKQYYECHVTCRGNKNEIQAAIEAAGWIFSCIDGDPDLGKGVKCYATRQFNIRCTQAGVECAVTNMGNRLRSVGVAVLREKIEQVLYDKRYPACPPAR